MARKNAYLAQQQAKKAAELHFHRKFTIQWCSDAAILAAHDVFHRKGDIIAEFHAKFMEYSQEIAQMTLDDAKDDRHIDYTKGKVDGLLKDILGDNFVPWEERYDIR